MSDFIQLNQNIYRFKNDESWVVLSAIEQKIKFKIEAIGTPLKDWNINIYRGVLTGYNEAFIIDGFKKDELIKEDPKSAEIIRPILRGRDIKKYDYEFSNLWLLNIHNGIRDRNIKPIDIDSYPAIKKHLDLFYPALQKRLDKGVTPYHLRNCAYMDDFFKQKIIWGEISDTAKFGIELSGEFVCEATSFLLTGESLQYLTCFLNSKLSAYLFSKIGTTTGVGTIRWKKYTIEQLLVPKLTEEKEKVFIDILNKILIEKIPNQKEELQNHLDDLIFEETKLSPEEIHYIKFEATI